MEAALRDVLATLSAHPGAAYAVLFAAALAESLAVVGMAVPGVVIMFAAGALIADGVLDFWTACALAISGAISGDSFSYWLGRHYRHRLRSIWPFNRHPAPLERGIAFFSRHGSKSVVLGRFVGPVRAIVPLVAGMLEMPTRAFFSANIGSALIWGPAYLVPGIVFGASLKLAAEAATGLVFVGIGLLLLLIGATLATRRLVLWASPRAAAWVEALLRWAELHPVMGRIAAALADPRHPDATTLAGLALALILAALALGLGLGSVLLGPENLAVNRVALDIGRSLSAPTTDRLMAAASGLGNPELLFALVLGIFVHLRLRGRDRDAYYWLAAGVFPLIAAPILGSIIGTERPSPDGEFDWALSWPWSFPSPQMLGSVLIYGFLAVLIARELPTRWRWVPFALASALISALACTRIYFGVEWLTDILASVALALVWLTALGLAFSRHSIPARRSRALAATALVIWMTGFFIVGMARQTHALAQYRPEHPRAHLSLAQWQTNEPRELPAARLDLWRENRQPFDIHYAGSLDLLTDTLLANGWQQVDKLNWYNALRLLSPSSPLHNLPLVPHVHQGRHESLSLARDTASGERVILRLWATHFILDGIGPVWIGDLTRVKKEPVAGLLVIPRTIPATQHRARRALLRQLEASRLFVADKNGLIRVRQARRPNAAATDAARSDDPAPGRP